MEPRVQQVAYPTKLCEFCGCFFFVLIRVKNLENYRAAIPQFYILIFNI